MALLSGILACLGATGLACAAICFIIWTKTLTRAWVGGISLSLLLSFNMFALAAFLKP